MDKNVPTNDDSGVEEDNVPKSDEAGQNIPEQFRKIVKDLVKDVLITFPEYREKLDINIVNIVTFNDGDDSSKVDASTQELFEYCKRVFPERFFDILYQNIDIFTNPTINTEFLPGIKFAELWNADISDKTRVTLWKYLQLLLFSVITSVNNDSSFGDTAKLFEAIDEGEFKSKLEETMSHMHEMFNMDGNASEEADHDHAQDHDSDHDADNSSCMPDINMDNLPKAEEIHEHISGMLDGKLGNLAKEIAAETADELNMDMDAPANVNDIFEKLFKNPGKLMGLVKNVGDKLDVKLKSGELKESELIEEAQALMKKMKDMPGMGNFQEMMSKMGAKVPGGGSGGAKLNMNAMNAQMSQNLRQAKMKERMQEKLRKRQDANPPPLQKVAPTFNPDEMTHTKFTTGEGADKTPLNPEAVAKSKKKNRRKHQKKPKNVNPE